MTLLGRDDVTSAGRSAGSTGVDDALEGTTSRGWDSSWVSLGA